MIDPPSSFFGEHKYRVYSGGDSKVLVSVPMLSAQIRIRVALKIRTWISHTLRGDDNSIADYVMQWNPQSQDSRQVCRPKSTWCRTGVLGSSVRS